ILDTSVIIDGRIADIAETGFLESKVIVPKFVLDELQAIADAPDRLKRNRGRRGLDMLNRLRQNPRLEIVIHEGLYDDHESVDGRLVKLAKQTGGRIVTNDFNLNKVARLQGVDVMNINDLANALKTVHLPGEEMILKIIKPGEEAGQGIGYLDDGTMVVVDHGRESIGREIPIIVTSVIQTSAGRMVFARMKQG
ncbi:MAG: PIN domain-containing protein, partial [Planctomycetota bacterium]